MIRFLHIYIYFSVFVAAFSSREAFAQGEVRIIGTVERYGSDLGGASVALHKNGTLDKRVITGSNGRFDFLLDLNKDYIIEASKPDHVTVKVRISTHLPAQKIRDGVGAEFVIRMDIFEIFPGLDLSILEKPIAHIKYNPKRNQFGYDEFYFQSIKARLKKLYEDVEDKRDRGVKPIKDPLSQLDKKREVPPRPVTIIPAPEPRQPEPRKEKPPVAPVVPKKAPAPAAKAPEAKAPVETESQRLAREKEERAAVEKENRNLKKEYENELLKIVAENERAARAAEYMRLKGRAEANAAIERMKAERGIKPAYSPLLKEGTVKEAKAASGRQAKAEELKKLMQLVAEEERKEQARQAAKDTNPRAPVIPLVVTETKKEKFLKTEYNTTVQYNNKVDTYTKTIYLWGNTIYYKNFKEIPKQQYLQELSDIR